MKIHNVAQGSAEWLALRARFRTASEAPAMMGASKYQTRTDLLAAKKTGITPDITPSQQFIFDKGHATEALARPLTEALIGEELYPIVATEGNLLASMDGATMLGETLFEHKLWNESVVAQVKAGDLAPHYYWQLEQQLLVSGAERVIFVCSDGTPENFVHMEYRPVAGRAAQLVEGWKQFEADLANFKMADAPSIVVGKAPDELPALRIELTGMVTASNLKMFEDSALAVIDSVKTTLSTDQDFADAKKAVKWCGDVEEAVAVAKKQALSQTQSIDELFSSLDRISAHARETRLKVDKLVKAQELLVKTTIKQKAELALADHIAAINKTLGKVTLPHIISDFAGAMKSKRTIASLQDAVDTELARAKIDASQAADSIRLNLTSLAELAVDHAFLFSDVQQLVTKANDDLVTLIKFRISEHQQAEQAKADAKRIAEEQEAQRLAAIKPEPVVEKVAAPEPARATPVQTAAPVAQATKPVTSHVVEQVALQASVTDFEALVKAVAYGQAPISVLSVNWEALDAMVAAQGSTFSMAGVTLAKAAA
ncbi:YqaJ viral recombinase family protein [Pseudomonas lundensis]|uniref:Heme peroxidase n=2 Tax=Pseudomonas TaxID=286 RepID=A0ABS1ZJT0_9PSED|nr:MULTISPECIES: YqaJ viral recombinase family protein [Pseudomonas]MBM1183466.1 YqaJ viral recombinase family protein [Pseudomonas lundensis]MBM1196723.1 Heme peroxidase [Pseudomonas weihenstephanensis]MCT8954766.1 YqaJ viral recombinase family protein [Pseudomonas lundensis]NLT99616.1 Heme peroxidase [Pseudomonas lundensis]NMZ54136.1 Heme peroxidase [Pseudomonas lundensis]